MADSFNVVDLFFKAAAKNPDAKAIIFKNSTISFKELQSQVITTSHYFIKKGISKGDRVLILVPMSIDLYRIVLALFTIGATAVFFDEWVSMKRMQQCCRIVKCKAFIGIFKARVVAFFLPELSKIPIKLSSKYVAGSPGDVNTFPVSKKDDTALITFTTGSTGSPKAAKRTHEFLWHQFNALVQKIQPQEDDIDMPVLPIVLLINLGTGATSVIPDHKASKPGSLQPQKIIEQIQTHSVNRITASPFFIKEISKYIISNKIPADGVSKIFTGGAPVFPNEAALYIKAFPKAKIEIVYGSTEAEPITSINAKELLTQQNNIHSRGLMVGHIDIKTEVKIIQIINGNISISTTEELSGIELPVTQIGEIIVRGDHVLREYVNDPEALNRNKIFIGDTCWHRTGDCGSLDENGMLYLAGRCSSLITINDNILSPFIYENYLQAIDGVETGTIVMLKDKITAVIELIDSSKKMSARNSINADKKNVEEIIFLKKIPRDPRHNSKIDYEKLNKLLMS